MNLQRLFSLVAPPGSRDWLRDGRKQMTRRCSYCNYCKASSYCVFLPKRLDIRLLFKRITALLHTPLKDIYE